MNAAEFAPIYVSLQAVCGKPHTDEDLNAEHMKQYLLALKQFEAPVVKQAVGRVIQNFGRTQFEAKWPKPGAIVLACEDIKAGQVVDPEQFVGTSERQRRQIADMMRIDRAIRELPDEDRKTLNHQAAIRVIEPVVADLCKLTKREMPERDEEQTDREWAIKLANRFMQLHDIIRTGDLGDGPGGTFSAKLLVLNCKELLEASVIIKMREMAKERGLV